MHHGTGHYLCALRDIVNTVAEHSKSVYTVRSEDFVVNSISGTNLPYINVKAVPEDEVITAASRLKNKLTLIHIFW